MQVAAEIHLHAHVLEYLRRRCRKAWHEAGRER